MTKRAILVIGVLIKDCVSVSKQMQAQLEGVHGGNWCIINEEDIVDQYVTSRNYHPLCKTAWLEPIKNNAIVTLLEKTENLASDAHTKGVIIVCPFALDADIKDAYRLILIEQGYTVEIAPVQCSVMSILNYSYEIGDPPINLFQKWMDFNQHFDLSYTPIETFSPAIIVDGNVTNPILVSFINFISASKCIIVIDNEEKTRYPFTYDRILIGYDKIDMFWRYVAYSHNLELVIESSAVDTLRWQKIKVPVISLTSQFALEKLV